MLSVYFLIERTVPLSGTSKHEISLSLRVVMKSFKRFQVKILTVCFRYGVYMDENGDAEGNYTMISRQRQRDASKGYGLFPAGRFTKLRNLTKNPVNFLLDGGGGEGGVLVFCWYGIWRIIFRTAKCVYRNSRWSWTRIGFPENPRRPNRLAVIAAKNA